MRKDSVLEMGSIEIDRDLQRLLPPGGIGISNNQNGFTSKSSSPSESPVASSSSFPHHSGKEVSFFLISTCISIHGIYILYFYFYFHRVLELFRGNESSDELAIWIGIGKYFMSIYYVTVLFLASSILEFRYWNCFTILSYKACLFLYFFFNIGSLINWSLRNLSFVFSIWQAFIKVIRSWASKKFISGWLVLFYFFFFFLIDYTLTITF